MLWQHKKQKDWSALPGALLPVSIFGAPVLASINTALWKTVNNSSTLNRTCAQAVQAGRNPRARIWRVRV
ncbi:MAG: hypothetical protein LH624_07725 [Cryobacterium sp.]|nr:hypothetical protein [Cryobacterium sp.]